MKKGIIFDLDGTLWDACARIADSWNEYLRKNEPDMDIVITEQDLRRTCGMVMTQIGDTLFPMLETERRHRVTDACCTYEVEYLHGNGGQVYPGLEEALKALQKKYHLYIVSNCQKGYIESFLDWSGLSAYFEDIECFGNTGDDKADNIRLLVKRNGLGQVVYLGDTQGDADSAAQAGVEFIHAAYGFGQVPDAKHSIAALDELPDVVQEMLS